MPDARPILRPLEDEHSAIDALTTYETPVQLAAALTGAWRGVERSLRHLLRADPTAPDDLRLSALSPADLTYDRLLPALSRRNLISLKLAGMAHQLEQIARRAEAGSVHAADADAALAAIAQLREEVIERADFAAPPSPHAPEVVTALSAEDARSFEPVPSRRGVFLVVLLIAVLGVVALVLLTREDPLEAATSAFGEGRMGVAESGFRAALERDDDNLTALLYLGRIYRLQERHGEAADVLHRASELAPRDAGVRRELGNLFLDLNRPGAAVEQFRLAQEIEPDSELNWMGLIRALRAAGDAEAEEVLRRAPAGVRARLTSGLLPPDTT